MRTEQLTNLHPGWVVGGWLTAAAVTAACYLTLVGIGLLPVEPDAVIAVASSLAVGFFAGGLVVGLRWMDAPTLHAVAITLLSMVVWFLGSLGLRGDPPLDESATTILGLLILQLVAATLGGWTGRWLSLGRAGPPS
jgi:hypothetical protein